MQNLIDPVPTDGSDGADVGLEGVVVSGTTGSGSPDVLTAEEGHKVRDYLTVILGSLEQLQHQALDDRGRRQLRRAEKAAELMTKIVG